MYQLAAQLSDTGGKYSLAIFFSFFFSSSFFFFFFLIVVVVFSLFFFCLEELEMHLFERNALLVCPYENESTWRSSLMFLALL